MIGKVKFFNYEKGFGFIAGSDGIDYFVHAKDIKDQTPDENEKKTLGAGWEVDFECAENEKGKYAKNVKAIY